MHSPAVGQESSSSPRRAGDSGWLSDHDSPLSVVITTALPAVATQRLAVAQERSPRTIVPGGSFTADQEDPPFLVYAATPVAPLVPTTTHSPAVGHERALTWANEAGRPPPLDQVSPPSRLTSVAFKVLVATHVPPVEHETALKTSPRRCTGIGALVQEAPPFMVTSAASTLPQPPTATQWLAAGHDKSVASNRVAPVAADQDTPPLVVTKTPMPSGAFEATKHRFAVGHETALIPCPDVGGKRRLADQDAAPFVVYAAPALLTPLTPTTTQCVVVAQDIDLYPPTLLGSGPPAWLAEVPPAAPGCAPPTPMAEHAAAMPNDAVTDADSPITLIARGDMPCRVRALRSIGSSHSFGS